MTPEQHDDREQDAAQPDRQVVELGVNWSPVNSGMITPAKRMKNAVMRAEDREDQDEQRRGEPERLAPLALLEQLGEDRDERRAQRRVGEQAADEVRDLEGDRERREGARSRSSSRRRPRAPARRCARARCAIEKIAVLRAAARPAPARASSGGSRPSARAGALAVGRRPRGRCYRRSRGFVSGPAAGGKRAWPLHCVAASWPTFTHRRSGSCAPSVSAWRTAATRRRSRRTSGASRPRSRAATPTRPDRAPRAVSPIDKAVKSGALHRNTGARKKSRAARMLRGVERGASTLLFPTRRRESIAA